MKLKGFIFDLDGTLLDTLPVCYIGFRKTLLEYTGREYTDAEIATLFGPSEEGIFKKLLPNCWQDALNYYLAEYERAHHGYDTFPGMIQALTLLREKQIRLAIVSGKGPGSMGISLRYSGLKYFFETIISGAEQGANKPANIRQVLRVWKYEPEEVIYIGDTAYDIKAAKEVEVQSIGALWADTADAQKVKNAHPLAAFEDVEAFIQWIQGNL
jgi:pyrophosphatase PpaX